MSFQTLPLYNLLTQCLLLVTLYDFVRQLIDISKLLSIGLAAAAATLGAMYVDARYSIRSDLSHVLAARKVEKGQVSLRVIHQMGIITLDDTDTRWHEARDERHLYYRFKNQARAMPDRVYLLYDDRSYTFRKLEQGTSTIKMNETWHLLLCMHILKTQFLFFTQLSID